MRGSEVTSITHDGPLVTSVKRSGSVTDTLSFTYRSGDFKPTSFTYSGATQSFGYDADGLVVSAAPFTIARDAASGLATRVVAPGFALSRTYSAYGEIDAADYGAYRYALTRDVSGRIVRKTETTADGTIEWGYGYDTLGRLTSVTKDGEPFESYELDSHGNRTGMTAPWRGIEATVHASFDAEDRTTRIGEVDYTYTADGFIASKTAPAGTTRYTYTGLGELSSVLRPDGQRIDYTYDANGLRVAKAIDGRIVERYSWADNTRLLATYDGAGALTRRFLYADARTPYAMDTPAGRRYLAYDQVGSVRAVTDESGRVVGTLVHDSFGNVVEQSGEATSAGLGFAAGLSDPDTGLVLFGARDYDPASGRWMAKDPIGFAGGDVNLYGYCLGDPVNLVDPSGLLSVFFWDVYAFEDYGTRAVDYWAEKSINPENNRFETAAYSVAGVLAAFWTPCASDWTFTAVTMGTFRLTTGWSRSVKSTTLMPRFLNPYVLRDGSPALGYIDWGDVFRLERHMVGKAKLGNRAMRTHVHALWDIVRWRH